MKITLLIAVAILSCACGTGIHEVATAAKINAQATEKNYADYAKVVQDLTDNLAKMYERQLEMLTSRQLSKINLITDESDRLLKIEQLIDNQAAAYDVFMEKLNSYRAKALGAPNFKLAAKTSAAVSKYLGTVDDSAASINQLLDELGISLEREEVPVFQPDNK